MAPRPGDLVEARFTKWGGGRHWEFPLRLLGTDALGVWCGSAAGTFLERPAASFTSSFAWVTLFPHDRPWAASFYDSAEQPISVYVDVTTPPVWRGNLVTMVDLDLDVILGRDGSLGLDDEDEFEEHRMSLGYPPDLVRLARRTAAELMAAAFEGAAPFDDGGQRWLEQQRTSPP